MSNNFLSSCKEDADLNQYWYSNGTISAIIEELCSKQCKIAFLSTPSLYFSLPEDVRANCYVFDYDKQWANDRGYVFYDFNKPDFKDDSDALTIPKDLLHSFNMVVIDPPFITEDVWKKYQVTANCLLVPLESNGPSDRRILCTTVHENAELLLGLFGVKPTKFRPSIPHLVYQYDLYTNFESDVFAKLNPEVDF